MATHITESAFPVIGQSEGMTLVDYFAAKAMQQTMLAHESDWADHPYQTDTFLQWAAERAYAIAHEMMKARRV